MHWQMAGPAVVPSNLKPPSREHRRASWRPGRPRRRVTYHISSVCLNRSEGIRG